MYRVEIAAADGPEYSYVGSDIEVATESFNRQVASHREMPSHQVGYYGDTIQLQEFPDGGWDEPTTLQKWSWEPPHILEQEAGPFRFPSINRLDYGITREFLEDLKANGIREPVQVDNAWNIVDGRRRVIAAYILGIKVPYVNV